MENKNELDDDLVKVLTKIKDTFPELVKYVQSQDFSQPNNGIHVEGLKIINEKKDSLRERLKNTVVPYTSMINENSFHTRSKLFTRFYDKFIYIMVILAPISNLPQLYNVWIEKNVSGVSYISWFIFSLSSIAWFIYGFLHKDKHVMIMYSSLMIIQALIAIGAMMNR